VNLKFLILIIPALIFIASCTKPDLKPCQRMSSWGYRNIEACSLFKNNPEREPLIYTALGVIDPPVPVLKEKNDQFRVLLMGDILVSGEELPVENRISSFLQTELQNLSGKNVKVYNVGIRRVRTETYRREYENLLARYKPHLTIYLIKNEEIVARDYFDFTNLIGVCPIWDFWRLNDFTPSRAFSKTAEELFLIERMAKQHGIIHKNYWLKGGIKNDLFLKQVPGCDSFKSIVKHKEISRVDLLSYFSINQVPVETYLGLYRMDIYRAKSTQVFQNQRQRENKEIALSLVPWLIPELMREL